jgi:segregation and condensation protein B
MELSIIIPHIEALIFASDKPLAIPELVELLNNALGFIEDRATAEQIEASINAINEKYDSEFYSFGLVESGGGWQFLTKKEYHKTIAQLNGDKFLKKLSVASIETLSIIAYKQPVTKSEIELIRGVNCDYAVQKLLEKDLVVISGRKEDAVGKPLIYATSKSFMDYFGINSPEDLPRIREILNQEIIEATKIEREEAAKKEGEKESIQNHHGEALDVSDEDIASLRNHGGTIAEVKNEEKESTGEEEKESIILEDEDLKEPGKMTEEIVNENKIS